MARIRTIKPEFWSHEDLSALPEATHLLAAALLNYADDEGYFNANTALIKASCSPLREPSVSIHESLKHLSNIGYLQFGSADNGKRYGRIVKFGDHQRVNRPTESKIKELRIVYESSLSAHAHLTEPSPPEGKGREGKGIPPTEDAFASADPETPTGDPDRDWLWRDGTKLLAQRGLPDRKVRSCIGGWLKKSTAHQVREAVVSADRAQTGDPVPYITRILNRETRAINAMMVGLE